ncbi:hypothetical protein GQ457_12G017120 [Hibiscus cannabinus]
MEEYNQINENSYPSGNFLYSSQVLASNSSPYGRAIIGSNVINQQTQIPLTSFHLQSSDRCQSEGQPIVKTEASSTSQHSQKFHIPFLRGHQAIRHQQEGNESSSELEAIKSKIIAHPHYPNLVEAYMDCQKVGAPTEVVARLAAIRQEFEARQRSSVTPGDNSKDPELDQFMEAYYNMLMKHREELTRPIQEAWDFMRRIETQLNMLGNGPVRIFNSDERCEGVGSSEEDEDNSGGETEVTEIDPRVEDRELKNHLLRKYRGCLSNLKQQVSKKKKKGKLPKEARQKLLSWWELHYNWPYPSEIEKVALAESTGLDQKQINNWFINQRKRHWKPSKDMQLMVMHGHYTGDGPYSLGP